MERDSLLLYVLCFLVLALVPCLDGKGQREHGLRCPLAIFGFGDSLSDTGELLRAFPSLVLAGNDPYGDTFPGYPTGRYSDGRLVIDFIVDAFGFPLLDPFFDSLSPDFKHGVNFAAAGSTARMTPVLVPFFLSIQVDHAIFFHKNAVRLSGSKRPKVGVPRRSYFTNKGLYIIEIGGNDANYELRAGTQMDVIRTTTAPETASNISAAITRLNKEIGARQFLVFNIPPLGCTAYALTLFQKVPGAGPVDEYGCLSGINGLIEDFNALIKAQIEEQRERLQDVVIVFADFYKAVLEVVKKYQDYGFKEPLKACCGSPTVPYNFDPVVGCGMPGVEACEDPSEYIIWDGIHFTEATARIVAQSVLEGKVLDPPIDLANICDHVKWTTNRPILAKE